MGIIILATIFFPEYSVPSIMPTTRNCLTSCRGHACIREQKVRIISWKDSSIWRPSSHWLQMRQMPEHLTRQFLQMTFAGNSPLYVCVCVCVFFAAVWLSTYFIKREAAFMCYRFVTNIQCHSTLQTTPGHAPTLLNTHAWALVPRPHLVCLL